MTPGLSLFKISLSEENNFKISSLDRGSTSFLTFFFNDVFHVIIVFMKSETLKPVVQQSFTVNGKR